MHPIVLMQFAAPRAGRARTHNGPDALVQHERADDAEEHHIAKANHQIDLANRAQKREQRHPGGRPQKPADQQDRAHFEIDIAAPPMGDHAGNRTGDDLIGLGADSDRRRHTDEYQQRSHQKPTAHAEDAGQHPDHAAHPQNEENVHRHLGDGQVDIHQCRSNRDQSRPGGVLGAAQKNTARPAGMATPQLIVLCLSRLLHSKNPTPWSAFCHRPTDPPPS